jgi:(E)-2-((N-methylformamido)methylene)succinate hydrolase
MHRATCKAIAQFDKRPGNGQDTQLQSRDALGVRRCRDTTLVLLRGVGSRLEAWDGVAAQLRDRFQLLRYDPRGRGESETVPARTRSKISLKHARANRRSSIRCCHVAGVSLGGLITQAFALSYPDRLRKLALISTVAGRTPEEKARVCERLDIIASGIPGDHFRKSLDR